MELCKIEPRLVNYAARRMIKYITRHHLMTCMCMRTYITMTQYDMNIRTYVTMWDRRLCSVYLQLLTFGSSRPRCPPCGILHWLAEQKSVSWEQGCQIFLGTYTKWPQTIPSVNKVIMMSIKYATNFHSKDFKKKLRYLVDRHLVDRHLVDRHLVEF
jgi:hypothetical protein